MKRYYTWVDGNHWEEVNPIDLPHGHYPLKVVDDDILRKEHNERLQRGEPRRKVEATPRQPNLLRIIRKDGSTT